jgi:tRNA (guanine-N7-)-methyltransferase
LNKNYNFLGLDIRQSVLSYANELANMRGLTNLSFIQTNANIDIKRIIEDINNVSTVSMIYIQFPDPYFKRDQRKRRLVNPTFATDILSTVIPGTKVFFQSDIKELAEEAINVFCKTNLARISDGFSESSLQSNPSASIIPTERELQCVKWNQPVYRIMLEKC